MEKMLVFAEVGYNKLCGTKLFLRRFTRSKITEKAPVLSEG
jgi:hypothetical protein